MRKTLENLTKAWIWESQARNRYDMYAKVARKEGYPLVAKNFEHTAVNEQQHGKWYMRMIQDVKEKLGEPTDLMMHVEADADTVLWTTTDNLKACIAGEHYEYSDMYIDIANTAKEEWLPEIFARVMAIANAEKHHEEKFKYYLNKIETDTLYSSEEEVEWVCDVCGHVHKGKRPPEKCPSCDHPYNYFEILK